MSSDAAATRKLARFVTFVRSLLAGAAATIADLSVLALMVGALGLSARLANVPSLLVGAIVQFFGNRHFAFEAARGSIKRQVLWFSLAEVVALGLNAVLYDLFAQRMLLDATAAVLLRLAISFVVFVGWSYPVFKRVFSVQRQSPSSARA